MKYEKQEVELQTFEVEGLGPNVLARDCLRVLRLNWKELFKMQVDENNQESLLGRLIDSTRKCFEKDFKHSQARGQKSKWKQR